MSVFSESNICRYHMYGSHVDKLNVYIKNKPSLGQPVFTVQGTKGSMWIKKDITIRSSPTYQVRHHGGYYVLFTGDT